MNSGLFEFVAGELGISQRDSEARMQKQTFKDAGNKMVDELVDWAIQQKTTHKERIYNQWQTKFMTWYGYVIENEEIPAGIKLPVGNHQEIKKLVQKIKQESKKEL